VYSLYRRHEAPDRNTGKGGCRFYGKGGARHFKCNCPVWMDGLDENGKRQRRTLKTRSWSQAQARLDEIERGGLAALPVPVIDHTPTIDKAIDAYLDDCRARNLAAATVKRYKNILGHLPEAFPGRKISQLNLEAMTGYRASRVTADTTKVTELGTIRALFRFCEDRDWIAKNPAKRLKSPKSMRRPTLPFDTNEVNRIIAACDRINNQNPLVVARSRPRCRALVLTMLYTGFRISDAIKLKREDVDMATGMVTIRIMKTGVPLRLALHPDAVKALAALPVESPYFFWNGTTRFDAAIDFARRTLERLMKLADIKGGHPHRFRDTFAVELLVNGGPDRNGVDLRTVQLLLGHTSIKTTEKHYAPFVASMQRGLNQAVSTLQFGSSPDRPGVNAQQNAPRNRKRNVLPFARSESA
jgi:integrase/recombinase XerD